MLNATQISALAIACSLSYLSLPASAAAAPRDALFQSAQGQARNVEAGPNALRGKSRSVKIDEATLGKAHMRLNLGIGPEFNAIRERQAERRDGRKAWIGRVKGDKDSEVVLVSKGNAVAGTIRHNGRLYKLEPSRSGGQRLEEVLPSDPLPSSEMMPDLPGIGTATTTDNAASYSNSHVLDILVAYTPEAKAAYGAPTASKHSSDWP